MSQQTSAHEPGDLSLAAFIVLDHLMQALNAKGVLSGPEIFAIWQKAAAANAAGPSSNKQGIAAVLKAVAPAGAGL